MTEVIHRFSTGSNTLKLKELEHFMRIECGKRKRLSTFGMLMYPLALF
jgi:hypothetical protein